MASGVDVPRAWPPLDWSFHQLLVTVSESLTGEAFIKAKRCCIGELGKPLVEIITEPWDLLEKLKEHGRISKNNIVLLQRLVYFIPNVALRAKTQHSIITYAKDAETFYVEESPPSTQVDDSSQLMHIHIQIHLPQRLRYSDTARLELDVARIFGVNRNRVAVVGVIHGNSYVVTLKIPRECAEMIPYLVELGIKEYITLEVDKIALEGQMYDLKDKKRVVENVEEHQEDFLSVYENLEKKQQKIQDLELRLHIHQKQWQEESKNFSKSEIEKQLRKGDLCDLERCGEEAAKITDQLVNFTRESHSMSHLQHLLKDQKKWTKGSDIKMLAVIVGEALRTRKTSITEIKPFLRSLVEKSRDIPNLLENNKDLLLKTTLPDRNFRLVIVSQSGIETGHFVNRLFDKDGTFKCEASYRVHIEQSGWTTIEEKGECITVKPEDDKDRHIVFVERLLEKIEFGDDDKISEVHVSQFKDNENSTALHHILLPRNAVYLLLINLDHRDVDDVAGFIDGWISNIGCHLFEKTAKPVFIVGLHDDQSGNDIAKKFFDNVKNKCPGFETFQLALDSAITISREMTGREMSSIRQKIVEILTVESQWPKPPASYFIWESKIQAIQLQKQHVLTTDLFGLGLDDGVIPFESQNEMDDFLYQQHCAGNILSLQSEELKNYVILHPDTLLDEYKWLKDRYGLGSSEESFTGSQTEITETSLRGEKKSIWRTVLQTLGLLLPVQDPHSFNVGATAEDFLITENLPVKRPRDIHTPKFGFSFPERFFPLALFHMFLNRCLQSWNLVPYTLHRYGCEFCMSQGRFVVYFDASHKMLYIWIDTGELQQFVDDLVKEERKKVRFYTEKTLNDISRILRLEASVSYYLKCPQLSVLSEDGLYDPGSGQFFCHFHETPHYIDEKIYEN